MNLRIIEEHALCGDKIKLRYIRHGDSRSALAKEILFNSQNGMIVPATPNRTLPVNVMAFSQTGFRYVQGYVKPDGEYISRTVRIPDNYPQICFIDNNLRLIFENRNSINDGTANVMIEFKIPSDDPAFKAPLRIAIYATEQNSISKDISALIDRSMLLVLYRKRVKEHFKSCLHTQSWELLDVSYCK